MNGSRNRVGMGMLVGCAFIVTAVLSGCGPSKPDRDVKRLADFEDGTMGVWKATGGATAEVASAHASQGKKALHVTLPAEPYPGIGFDVTDGDWTRWDALRFTAHNPGPTALAMAVRIDDADSAGYAQRFNLEGRSGFTLGAKRTTTVELPMKALALGTLESRGLHLDRIKLVRFFFAGLKKPATVVFDDFQLVRAPRDNPDVLPVTTCNEGDYTPHKGASIDVVGVLTDQADGDRSLLVTFGADGPYPGVDYPNVPENWLAYNLLTFNVHPASEVPKPFTFLLKITDTTGRSRTCATCVAPEGRRIAFPLDIVGQIGLGHVKTVSIFTGKQDPPRQALIGPLSLERVRTVRYRPVHAATVENAMLTLDFTTVGAGGKNSCWGATVHVPLTSGAVRTFRCSSPGKKQLTYAAPGDVLEDMDYEKPIRVWAYFFDHGQWTWGRKEVKATAGAPVVVRFTSRRDLSQ